MLSDRSLYWNEEDTDIAALSEVRDTRGKDVSRIPMHSWVFRFTPCQFLCCSSGRRWVRCKNEITLGLLLLQQIMVKHFVGWRAGVMCETSSNKLIVQPKRPQMISREERMRTKHKHRLTNGLRFSLFSDLPVEPQVLLEMFLSADVAARIIRTINLASFRSIIVSFLWRLSSE
jgi:hypothetical protein